MQLTTVLAVHDWVKRPDVGANYWQDRVEVDPIHARPPAIVYFAHPYDPADGRMAEMKPPPAFPALYVGPDGLIEVDPEVATRSRDAQSVGVALRYLARTSNFGQANADAAYAMEAIHASLREFFAESAAGRAARTRNGKYIIQATRTTYGPWKESIGDAQAIAAFGLTVHIRNLNPSP